MKANSDAIKKTAPQPSHAIGPSIMSHCKDNGRNSLITPLTCDPVSLDVSDSAANGGVGVSPDEVVFVGMIPAQHNHGLVRWFQYLLGFLNLRIVFDVHNQVEDAFITMQFRLAYSDADQYSKDFDDWTEFASTTEERRPLECLFNYTSSEEYNDFEYDCDPIFVFQLGSLPHKRYLLNMKIPVAVEDTNQRIGKIKEIETIGISQTGGFTQVWLAVKSFLFCVMFFPLVWFWRRIKILARNPMLIEKACFVLGLSMIFVNLPIEYFTVFFDVPWMLLFTDVRGGLFYAVLFSFWVIFTGEHLMDQAHRNKLSSYKCHLSCISLTSLALLAFDIAERGVQLLNPFGTVWSHPAFGYSLLALGCLSAVLYFILLLYLVFKVFRSIRYKRRFILQDDRAARFQHTVRRLKVMMLLTLATAGLTIAFFFLEQAMDGVINEFVQERVEVASAFFFGVYGLWNVYVCIVLFMYAPSHKQYVIADVTENDSEEHEMAALNQNNTEVTEMLQVAQQKERED